MSRSSKILLSILIVFISIQFIQPAHNKGEDRIATDVTNIFHVPDSVQQILQNSCYDCHSNNTRYPWYFNIQPIAWIMAEHIKDGKAELNFSEFGSYSARMQKSKLQGIVNSIRNNEMPLESYWLIHRDARLTPGNKSLLISWASNTKDSLEKN